jgi:hypothetical protein
MSTRFTDVKKIEIVSIARRKPPSHRGQFPWRRITIERISDGGQARNMVSRWLPAAGRTPTASQPPEHH